MLGSRPHNDASLARHPSDPHADAHEPTHTRIPSPLHLGASRHPLRALARLGRTSLLLITTLLLATAAAQPTPARITALTADPTNAEEGTYVDFTAALDPGDEGSLVHTWDFGDGITATGIDLLAFRHRYGDDGTYTVTHTIERADGSNRRSATLSVTITNVAPELRRIQTSHGPIPGFPVTLTAAAGDPGDDTLTYTWDFGDGTPPATPSEDRDAVHTYDAAGTYVVSVTVDDGDGGSDTLELEVVVGDGFGYELSGDVTARPRAGASPTLTGLPIERGPDGGLRFRGDLGRIVAGDPDATDGPGSCLDHPQLPEHRAVRLPQRRHLPQLHRRPGERPRGRPLPHRDHAQRRHHRGARPIRTRTQPARHLLRQPARRHRRRLRLRPHRVPLERRHLHHRALRRPSPRSDLPTRPRRVPQRAPTTRRNPPRTAHAYGVIRHDVNRVWGRDLDGLNTTAGATFGDAYLCGSSGELNVVSHDMGSGPESADGTAPSAPSPPDGGDASTAAPNALLPPPVSTGSGMRVGLPWRWEPYADGDAKLEFTFDRPMNPDTLDDRTVWLDIPAGIGPGAPFEPISGIVEAVSDTTYRFLPDWDMRPGVLYEVRILGGEDGVRGASGEILEQDYTWRFQTQVELESVVATVTQVSRGAMLVPHKPTVVRVYAFWRGHDDIPPELQVFEVAAEVAVEVDGVNLFAPRSVVLRRPDQYGEQERLDALHTVNFFGWRPTQFGGRSTLTATVDLASEPAGTSPRFESPPVTLRHWDRSPTLSLEYYYLEVGSWAGGVPTETLNAHARHVQRSADFATQNLPVVGIDTWWRGPLAIDEPEMEVVATTSVWRTDCVVPTTSFVFTDELILPDRYAAGHPYDWRLAWELHRATSDSRADVVVGIVPDDVATDCGWLGVMVLLKDDVYSSDLTTPRYILLGESALVPALAHELGHFFGLCHETDDDDGCVYRFGTSIEGFRIALDGATGHNKSQTEGNGEGLPDDLVALMFSAFSANDPGREAARFITDQHYRRLFTTMPQRNVAGAPFDAPIHVSTRADDAWAHAMDGDQPRVSVWALLAPDGRTVLMDRLRPTHRGTVSEAFGAYGVALVDAAGVELASVTVVAHSGETVPQPGAPDDASSGSAPDGPLRAIDAVLPYDDRAQAVVVTLDGHELARITRSANPPTLDAHLDGNTIHWTAGDADGDPVVVDVDYAPDGQAWTPLAVSQPSSGSRSLHSGLEPGVEPVLRVRASDGFDTVERRLPLATSPTVRIVARSHVAGDVLEQNESLWVVMNAPLAAGQDPGTLATLEGPDGQPVELVARLLPGSRRLLVTPRGPLEPGAYRVDVGAAFRALGAAPPDDAAWQVVVAAAASEAAPSTGDEAAREPTPIDVAASIPAMCGGVDRASVEALLPAGHELQEVVDDATCTVRVHIGAAPERARTDVEFALLRQRYLPTRNAQDGAAVVIDFEGNGRAGSLRLEPDGAGASLTLRIAPR
jgi:PKD repeat protein